MTRTVFVSGAASGIGQAVARRFAREEVRLALFDRDDAKLAAVAAEFRASGREVLELIGDQRISGDVEQVFARIGDAFGHLDVAVNNAGAIGFQGTAAEIGEADWSDLINLNLNGTWRCMHHELRMMLPRGSGAICNVSSIWGLTGGRVNPAYVAAKHGIVGLTRAAALDHARSGVRVNAICPGSISTQLMQEWLASNEGFAQRTLAIKPMGRLGDPDEIAGAVFWMCGDEASFLHGAAIVVDGAETVGPPAAPR